MHATGVERVQHGQGVHTFDHVVTGGLAELVVGGGLWRSSDVGTTLIVKLTAAMIPRQDRMRAPSGSNSGSAATIAGTHSPKISTSAAVPGAAAPAGRYPNAIDRPTW